MSDTENFIDLDISNPLAQSRGWVLIDNGDQTQNHPLWVRAMTSLFEVASQAIEQKWPLPPETQAYAVLSGDRTYEAWNGNGDGMGFHALVAYIYDEEVGEDYLEVAGGHLCHVNLQTHDRLCREDIHDEASILSALATLPHEMAHVALFARHTKGKTPLEVFDEGGGGEGVLAKVLAELEDQAIEQTGKESPYGGNEDVVEAFANDLVDHWMATAPEAREIVRLLVDSLAPRRKLGM